MLTKRQIQIQKEVIAVALKMQDRFVPEPVFAKTGKGYLKSEGVAPLIAIKKQMIRRHV